MFSSPSRTRLSLPACLEEGDAEERPLLSATAFLHIDLVMGG